MELLKNKKYMLSIFVILLFATVTISQLYSVHSFRGGRVRGTVTCGGSAVSNAKVSLFVYDILEDDDYTDASGDYLVIYTNLMIEPIPARISVEKSGYTTIERETTLYPNSPTNLDIEWEIDQRCKGYVYDHVNSDLSGATVKLIRISDGATLGTDTTDSNGYYDFTTEVMENLYCKVQASNTGYETHDFKFYSTDIIVDVDFRIASTSASKIAAFFYATDATNSTYLSTYGDQLDDEEGFDTILYFNDTSDWEDNIDDIDDLESEDSFVFIYVCAHGAYDSGEENSYCDMVTDPGENLMYSDEFTTKLLCLESKNIFVLIDSCKSGGFVDDVKDTNRFVISSTDTVNDAYVFVSTPGDPIFAHYFFERIEQNYNDYDSYLYARQKSIEEHSDVNPMFNDQIAYSWFEWW